ncbi:MAG: nitrilase-related carbon-nitrogen hydrolase [Nitrospinota bacterium]
MKINLGIAQVNPTLGNLDRNVEIFRETVKKAVGAGVDLLVFPELGLTGYFLKDMVPSVAQRLDSKLVREIRRASRKLSIVVGMVEESPEYFFYNSVLYLEKGEVVHVHRKAYLPTYGMFDEERYLSRGTKIRAFDTRFGRVAMLVCEDAWHPSTVYIASQAGAQILILPASSPGRGVQKGKALGISETWEGMICVYASLFMQFCVFVNRVGYEDGINFWGGSEVVGPTGRQIVKAPYFEEAFVQAKLDLSEIRRARIASPILGDEDLNLTIQELLHLRRVRENGEAEAEDADD